MRVLQLVTLFTPQGDFGGPARVAINQTRELRSKGVDVTLIAGSRGFGPQDGEEIDGVSVKLFRSLRLGPKARFASLCSPSLILWLIKNIRHADIVHIHLSRDLISLPAALIALAWSKPLVVQPHGTISPTKNLLAKALDKIATLRVLKFAHTVFYLSPQEKQSLVGMPASSSFKLAILPNGIPQGHIASTSASKSPDILFLARLNARKRPEHFVQMSIALKDLYPDATFSLVGPDGGMAKQIRQMIEGTANNASIRSEGSLPPGQTLQRMARSSVYVLPAIDEPFGMTVIEALSCGVPVVITDSCALASMVREERCGIVTDGSLEQLIAAVAALLDDPAQATEMGQRGQAAVSEHYGMDKVANILKDTYAASIADHDGRRQKAGKMVVS